MYVMNNLPYLIPARVYAFEEEIKKSLFITQLAHTDGIEQAKAFVSRVKGEHPSARHHCWGFVAGRPGDSMLFGFSDDGEPSGTAGKPILAQLSGSGIGEVTAVVTRYYGGIRLGTGGLVKAYGGGVQQALKGVVTLEKKIVTRLSLELDYAMVPVIRASLSRFLAYEVSTCYQETVRMIVEIEQRYVEDFSQTIVNKSGAKVKVNHLEN